MLAVNALFVPSSQEASLRANVTAGSTVRRAGDWVAMLADPIDDLASLASAVARNTGVVLLWLLAADDDAELTVYSGGRRVARLTTARRASATTRAAFARALVRPLADALVATWGEALVGDELVRRTARAIGIDPAVAVSNIHEIAASSHVSQPTSAPRAPKRTARSVAPAITPPSPPGLIGAIAIFARAEPITSGALAPFVATLASDVAHGPFQWLAARPHPERHRSGQIPELTAAAARSRMHRAEQFVVEPHHGSRQPASGVSVQVVDAGVTLPDLTAPSIRWFRSSDRDSASTRARHLDRSRERLDELADRFRLVQASITAWDPDARDRCTRYEARAGLRSLSAVAGLRTWTDRWLRGPGPTMWLGPSLLAHVDIRALATVATLTATRGGALRVETPPERLPMLTQVLRPVLPTRRDAELAEKRAHEEYANRSAAARGA